MLTRSRAWVLAAAVALALAACARAQPVREGSSPSEPTLVPIPPHSQPPAPTIEVESLKEAAAYVTFEPLAPSADLGPHRVLVQDPNVVPETHRALALEYDSGRYGSFSIAEAAAEATEDDLVAMAEKCSAAPECQSSESVVTLADGHRALLVVTSTHVVFLEWIETGVQVSVSGSVEELTAEEAVEIADQVG